MAGKNHRRGNLRTLATSVRFDHATDDTTQNEDESDDRRRERSPPKHKHRSPPRHTKRREESPPRITQTEHEVTVWYKDLTVSADTKDYVLINPHDGKLSRTKKGLLLNSSTFTISRSQGLLGALDHVKWLCFHKDTITVSGDETVYEAVMSACQLYNTDRPIPRELQPRVRNIHEDYRLCCSAMVLRDEITMIECMFLITNDAIYAAYQRQPSEKINLTHGTGNPGHPGHSHNHSEGGDGRNRTASFASAVLVMRRGCGTHDSDNLLDDSYKLGIGVESNRTTVKWYIGRKEVFSITRPGYRLVDEYQVLEHGGSAFLAQINSFKVGFGHYTFLDHQLPHNYAREHVHVDTSTDLSCHVPRSESGLVMLGEPDSYRETLPDLYGRHGPIVPTSTFAVTADSEKHRLFGQGMITRIKSLHVYNRYRTTVFPLLREGMNSNGEEDEDEDENHNVQHVRGVYRHNDSLMTPHGTEGTIMTGQQQQLPHLEDSGTPVMRRAYYGSKKTSAAYISTEPRTRQIDISADGELLEFESSD